MGSPVCPGALFCLAIVVEVYGTSTATKSLARDGQPTAGAGAAQSSAHLSEAVNLPHYRHLSLQLLLRFQDLTLAQAAFLHGVPSSEVSAHLQSLVNAEILQILENRELLASLNGLDSDVANQLVINVLPALRDWRSVPLFLFDKLHHLDSDGHLFNWTLRFYQSPALFDVELFQPMRYTCSLTDLLQFSAFTSSVLVKTADYFGLWHERNVLENAALLLHDQARFCNLVDSVLAEVKEPSYTGRICAAIQKTVGSLGQTMWEWRHIAAMDRELSADGHPGGPRSVPKLGYVAVLCRMLRFAIKFWDCYTAAANIGRQN
jgi:hypothetical protein